jgi:polyisoprenoid-binding protein YceI
MRGRRGIWVAAAIVAVVAIAGGIAFALGVFGGDEPEEAALSSPNATTNSQAPASDGGTGSADGTWVVDAASGSLEDGTSTFAGYRIDEELGGVGTNTAVGRTQDVEGSMTIEGTSITALSVTVDMTTLTSDDDRRDGQLTQRGLETATYPTATFALIEPVELDEAPAKGETIVADATGELTLHGVTNEVTVPFEARWDGDTIEAVASLDVVLADYDIEPPVGFLVLSIADTGTVEMHLLFTRG